MLSLTHLEHLPILDPVFGDIASSETGVTIVAGLEPRPTSTGERPAPSSTDAPLQPGGRSTIFGILFREMLQKRPAHTAIVSESKDSIRVPRTLRARVDPPTPAASYEGQMQRAIQRGAEFIVVDRLNSATLLPVFRAARNGVRVLAQLDTVFRGAQVIRQLYDLGVSTRDLGCLNVVVAVSRVPTLCTTCRTEDSPERAEVAEVMRRFPEVRGTEGFYRAGHCEECKQTGRKGVATVFDVFRARASGEDPFAGDSLLSLEHYLIGLAREGVVPLDDLLHLESHQLYFTYQLLTASEQALAETNRALNGKVMELELANRVLQKQTEASISLEQISETLISQTRLPELAAYVCRKAGEICGADRAVLYLLQPSGKARIVAVSGWDPSAARREVDAAPVLAAGGNETEWATGQPRPFNGWPPGIEQRAADLTGARVRAGLRVPLIAQNEPVGLLLFHSTVKSSWQPREVALLGSFANSSALAIQRAGLIESLRDKVERLEAAQAQIAKKERLESELELARQVQQSILPHIFPMAPGLQFAARSEPARQVGGDFYDVFLLDGNRCGVVVADVSDKGMPAALFMALTRSLLLAEARREASPYLVLQRVNQLLRELSQSEQFVTVFYGVVDYTDLSMTYVRAGHDRPVLLRGGEAIELQGKGKVLGVLDEPDLGLSEEKVSLQSGDRLVLYTDGLIDLLSDRSLPFGRGRLIDLMKQKSQGPLEKMCDEIFAELSRYQGQSEQYDDMTLLAVQVG